MYTVVSGGGLYKVLSTQNPTQLGLPLLDSSELPPCLQNTTNMCSRKKFLNLWVPDNQDTTPIYSNTAFQIFAYALESSIGQPFEKMLKRGLLNPMNLTGTSYTTPDDGRGAIPIDLSTSLWNYQLEESTP